MFQSHSWTKSNSTAPKTWRPTWRRSTASRSRSTSPSRLRPTVDRSSRRWPATTWHSPGFPPSGVRPGQWGHKFKILLFYFSNIFFEMLNIFYLIFFPFFMEIKFKEFFNFKFDKKMERLFLINDKNYGYIFCFLKK